MPGLLGPGPVQLPISRAVCNDCAARTNDANRQPVTFGNAGLSGGLVSSSPHAPVIDAQAMCFIDDVACIAEEARFGGVVVQVSESPAGSFAMLDDVQLLVQHAAILDELRRRGILRSRNNPTGDYGEWLVSSPRRSIFNMVPKLKKGRSLWQSSTVHWSKCAVLCSSGNAIACPSIVYAR